MLRGSAAWMAVAAVAEAAADLLPSDVTVDVSGVGPLGSIDVHGPRGYHMAVVVAVGPWVPFLPRALATRLTAIDALELIQDLVDGRTATRWPEGKRKVFAEVRDDQVMLAFADENGGNRRALPALARSLFE